MKNSPKISSFIVLAWLAIFISCNKNPSSIETPPPSPSLDTLRGREFEFNDLTWQEIHSPGPNVIVAIHRPDLFFNPFRSLEVTIRLDTSAIWLGVLRDTGSPYPAGFDFFYTIGGSDFFHADGGHLYIFPISGNHSLVGTKVSIKVKFI